MQLTEQQELAVCTIDRPVVLMAGAGSGKTTVLVERYLRLLARAAPNAILTVTFTNEASDQLRRRVLAELDAKSTSASLREAVERTPRMGTLHSFCYQVLDQYGSTLGLEPVSQIVTSVDMLPLFDRCYRQWRKKLLAEDLRMLIEYFGAYELQDLARNLYTQRYLFKKSFALLSLDDEDFALSDKIDRVMTPLFYLLDEALHQLGKYTFDDLEHLTLEIFEKRGAVVAALQKEVQFILVDEFQDTSQLQWQILNHVIGNNFEKLFIVGDPKQSIYRFRNADVRVFLAVSEQIKQAGGECLELTSNFRSGPQLIEHINGISAKLFDDGSVPFSPMTAGRKWVDLKNPTLQILRYHDEATELASLASALEEAFSRGALPNEIAVLFRVSDRINEFHKALLNRNILSVGHVSSPLFQANDVLDLVHYLKAIYDPTNDFYLAAFLRSPYMGWSYRQIAEALQREGDGLFDKLTNNTPQQLLWFWEIIESGNLEVSELLEALFRNTQVFPRERAAFFQFLKPLRLAGARAGLSEIIERLEVWEREGISFSSEIGQPGSQTQAVRLMTVHAAKGLEFSHVFLVDNLRQSPRRAPSFRLQGQQPPAWRYRRQNEVVASARYHQMSEFQNKEEAEETRRILYVALTRAKESLTVFLPQLTKSIPKGSFGSFLQEALVGLPI